MSGLQKQNYAHLIRNVEQVNVCVDLPVLSVIIPTYGVEDSVEALLTSLDHQEGLSKGDVEFIFVIDGSPDRSKEKISDWMLRTEHQVILLEQENLGVAGAQNQGLVNARGQWVSFLGPDDSLDQRYFSSLLRAIAGSPSIPMFVTRMQRVNSKGAPVSHPLDFKFRDDESRLVDLSENPEDIHLHAGMTVFNRDEIEASSLSFDERLREGFEDAHFVARYLLSLAKPQYLIVASAVYYYHLRETSITQVPNYAKYFSIIEIAYLNLLANCPDEVPTWVANLILYDLWWLFRQYGFMHSPVFAFSDKEQQRLDELSRNVLGRIGLQNIRQFRVVNLPFDTRAAWESAISPSSVSSMPILRNWDNVRKLQCVVIHSSAKVLDFSVMLDKSPIEVAFSKVRAIKYFECTWVYEHRIWIPMASNTDGKKIVLKAQSANHHVGLLFDGLAQRPGEIGHQLYTLKPQGRTVSKRISLRNRVQAFKQRATLALGLRALRTFNLHTKYKDAWVLIDRDIQANDNAEAYYRYLVSERADINSWFVINRSSPDYRRLKKSGFRVIRHGSIRHFVLMKHAKVLASSMIDHYIVSPFPRKYLPKTWTYVFLQHGVTKDLLDRWWNSKEIDVLITSTKAEFNSITEDTSPYKVGERETELTGMPRHDRLYELMQLEDEGPKRPCILIMPTWRNYLFRNSNGTGDREHHDGFYETDYVKNWSSFLNGELLTRLSQDDSVDVVLLPHPGIDKHWKNLELPGGMKRISYVGDDVQVWLAKTTLTITDYSSQAFEGAFCSAPTVYFQFDQEQLFAGGHIGSRGYFDYYQDGFGPVVTELGQMDATVDSMLRGNEPRLSDYERRIKSLYEYRDNKANERVTSAIERRLVPYCTNENPYGRCK